MAENSLFLKILIAACLFACYQFLLSWNHFSEISDNKLTLEAEVDSLARKKFLLEQKILSLEREQHRMELKLEKINFQMHDLLPLTKNRRNLPTIFFVTPTALRPTQKADLTRLSQTLSHVSNLYWIIVEDSSTPSAFISDILSRSKLLSAHLTAVTPKEKKMAENDPNWKLPRGVEQRNAALQWIRTNFAGLSRGIVYFGDDDNTYDWRLFDEIRSITLVGVWPVGIVGGLLVEAPILHDNLTLKGFNSIWETNRSFPIDMAGFAVNISLILARPDVSFSYNVKRGYQESYFLNALNITRRDLELKAQLCTKVYVWHTRTEKAVLTRDQRRKFWSQQMSDIERDAVQ